MKSKSEINMKNVCGLIVAILISASASAQNFLLIGGGDTVKLDRNGAFSSMMMPVSIVEFTGLSLRETMLVINDNLNNENREEWLNRLQNGFYDVIFIEVESPVDTHDEDELTALEVKFKKDIKALKDYQEVRFRGRSLIYAMFNCGVCDDAYNMDGIASDFVGLGYSDYNMVADANGWESESSSYSKTENGKLEYAVALHAHNFITKSASYLYDDNGERVSNLGDVGGYKISRSNQIDIENQVAVTGLYSGGEPWGVPRLGETSWYTIVFLALFGAVLVWRKKG